MTWRLDCGAYSVYIIEDGYYWRDPEGYHDLATERDWRFHPRNEQGQVRMNFGCYLITDGDRTVMVDAGIGDINGPPGMLAGLMPAAVDALGIARDSVETVVYSHMHYDHIGGSQRDGHIVFPEARHVFHRNEWEHWKNVDTDVGKSARTIMRPLLDSGRVDFVDGDTEILPGVDAVEAFGHTPGHLTVGVESGGQSILLGGDVSNHPFHVEHPHWGLPVDNDHEMAGATRDRIFDELADTSTRWLAGHYPMPGAGRIVTADGVRVFEPVEVAELD